MARMQDQYKRWLEDGTEPLMTKDDDGNFTLNPNYRNIEGGQIYDPEGNLRWNYSPTINYNDWGSQGFDAAIDSPEVSQGFEKNGRQYVRVGNKGWGTQQWENNPYWTEDLNRFVEYDPVAGAIVPQEVFKYASQKFARPESTFDKWMPSILGGLASFGLGGAAALQGAPSFATSLGQGLGLLEGGLPYGMTGVDAGGLSKALQGQPIEQLLNSLPGSESSVMGVEQTLPGTETLTTGVGDPFIDAYTPIGTGGGPTGLPLPGTGGVPTLQQLLSGAGAAATAAGASGGGGAPVENKDFTGGLDRRMTGTGINDVLAGTSAAGGVSALLKRLGIDVSPSTLGLIGTGLSTGLGVLGANQQDKALQSIVDSQKAITQPFITDALDMMQNPDKFYQRPEVTGAIDASLRGLSAKVGNPINNPGAIAQQAAYNTGLYNQALNTRLATALGGQDTLNRLQTTQALNSGNALNAIGSGLGSMLSTAPNINNLLAQYLLGKG